MLRVRISAARSARHPADVLDQGKTPLMPVIDTRTSNPRFAGYAAGWLLGDKAREGY